MRIWHYQLLPYLPEAQFKGQLRELIAIMHDWRDKGETNHLLINRVMEYPKSELAIYFLYYADEYEKRYNKAINSKYFIEFQKFAKDSKLMYNTPLFVGWHDKLYLRICMANLYEKFLATGKNKITLAEWSKLKAGYETITGEVYEI